MPPVTPVTVVVPVYRGWDHVRALLDGLDLPRAGVDVVVVDDASGDDGAAALAADLPHVRVLVRKRNGGFAAAVNTGLAAADGQCLVVANSDLLLHPGVVHGLAELVVRHPSSMIGPCTLRSDGSEVPIAQRFPTPWSSCWELFAPLRALRAAGLRRPARRAAGDVVPADWVVGSCMAFSRHWLEVAGPLDESYVMYGEELDWQRTAALRGLTSLYAPGLVVRHDESHGVDRASTAVDRRFGWIWRSRLRYFAKFWGPGAVRTTRLLCTASVVVSFPVWCVAVLVPRTRALGRAELRRARLLMRLVATPVDGLGGPARSAPVPTPAP